MLFIYLKININAHIIHLLVRILLREIGLGGEYQAYNMAFTIYSFHSTAVFIQLKIRIMLSP